MPAKPKSKKVDSLVATRIRGLRESLDLNQTEFARRLGMKQNAVSQWESGINRPNPDVLMRMAQLADGADKLFFLEEAGLPQEFLDGAPMAAQLARAATEMVAASLSRGNNTYASFPTPEPQLKVDLLKSTSKLGDPDKVQANDVDISLYFPPAWFPKGATIEAVRFPNFVSKFVSGEVIALVDTSRRDPDRLAGSVVVVRTATGTEPMTLRLDAGTYFLVPLQEDVSHSVRVLRPKGKDSIIGRVVKWIGEAPSGRK